MTEMEKFTLAPFMIWKRLGLKTTWTLQTEPEADIPTIENINVISGKSEILDYLLIPL